MFLTSLYVKIPVIPDSGRIFMFTCFLPTVSESVTLTLSEAILFGSIQFSIGSVEMSSKFSVMNFSKDQETLQNAAYALTDYLKIALLWTIGCSFILYSNFGYIGLSMSIFTNLVI